MTLQIVLLTLFASILVFGSVDSLRTSLQGVDHADQVIAAERELIKLNVDKETGLRGFQIAGDAVLLRPYKRSSPDYRAKV